MIKHAFKRMAAMLMVLTLCLTGAAFAEEGISIPLLDMEMEFEIPENEALQFVKNMRIGWNLGNTFDAYDDGGYVKDHMKMETYWCGATTTPQAIQALKDAGFNTLRIPVSWHNHVDENFVISTDWLDRVQEVADYAIALDMYVIINIHHDTHQKFYYPDEAHYDQSARYIAAIWGQVAERFKDYDEHLIFESINEPRLRDTALEWTVNEEDPLSVSSMDVINRLNQVFVDTVRGTGSNNATRYLMVPGYSASVDGVMSDHFVLPTDTVENRLIVSVHAYTPYVFALQDGGESVFDLEENGLLAQEIPVFMNQLYEKFIANGIPVVLGEFGARDKNGNLQDRVDFTSYYICNATARGMVCCWWDNHVFKGNGERFGILDRKAAAWYYPDIVDAMMLYAPEE